MSEKIRYSAFYVADKIDIVRYSQQHSEGLITRTSRELYYDLGNKRYLFMLSYGVAVFSSMLDDEIQERLKVIAAFSVEPKSSYTVDDLEVQYDKAKDQLALSFDTITLGRLDNEVSKMMMMHLAQSVALDHFNGISQQILSEVKAYTHEMQINGKVKLSHKNALKFIGKTLSTKNSIAENLYILDSPDSTWEDEYLDKLHNTLVRHFELVPRYKEIDNTLKIIEDNLTVYISYNHHRESSRLEWIIIILIVIEVLDTFASKL